MLGGPDWALMRAGIARRKAESFMVLWIFELESVKVYGSAAMSNESAARE